MKTVQHKEAGFLLPGYCNIVINVYIYSVAVCPTIVGCHVEMGLGTVHDIYSSTFNVKAASLLLAVLVKLSVASCRRRSHCYILVV
eukprot:m.169940 g.169940  ORF g.169940 m.169940 type:complete len:86 (+) comp39021_c1_seq7:700-957(+)